MNRARPGAHSSVTAGLGAVALCLVAGCNASGTMEAAPSDEGCVSTEAFFKNEVWGPTLSTNCMQCHNSQGAAKDTGFVLQSSAQTGFLEANYEATRRVAEFEVRGQSILLRKPLGELEHGGGERLTADSPEYAALESMVEQFTDPVACNEEASDDFFAEIEMMGDQQLLRRTLLNLVGRLPTENERQTVAEMGEAGIDVVLDDAMTEDAFYDRLKEVYNDEFLTDRYDRYDRAIDLLDSDDYPDLRFYEAAATEDLQNDLRYLANHAVAREPLELVAHVVRTDAPFTEILTADYILLNPFSARVYGVTDSWAYTDGDDPAAYDPDDWHEVQLAGRPHAGVMTSHMFLNRFPTTATNVNRHRSRMAYQFFLATDVLKLAERPVDPTQIQDFNPTMYNSACTVCHAVIDPVAGAFQNWDERGRYRPPEMGWNEDMRPPGFGEQVVPTDRQGESLRWLAETISQDQRFATSVVHTVFTALTGQEPVAASTDGLSPDEARARLTAFEAQTEVFSRVREAFVSDGYNFKTAVKEMAKSPYLRATNVKTDMSAQRRLELSSLGSGRLLTPEQLDRKIEAVLGYPWERYGRRQLVREFQIFYGGIDSDTVTTRITEPNGVMSAIQLRMANEMACEVVPRDFTIQDPAGRRLFPEVERSFVPEDDNGFEIPGAVDAIKANIRHLHQHILGEEVSAQELERTYQLFLATWREGKAAVDNDEVDDYLRYACRAEEDFWTGEDLPEAQQVRRDANYTVRAWMAVVTYLLTDWAFLHE